MIPKKIELKNFLSYGPETTTIDFANYNLICFSGKNGHGKSALLDAMTWAVWGQARKTTGTSKADDGLLHLGQKHMLVVFDFQIKNQHFRVRREYVKTKSKPFSALDFGVVSQNNEFTTMTDKTIKATQNKIEATIGISYDSFTNSAFLRQGQSNEFSKKSAKERKEILASILHLEQFDTLKKAASEKQKELNLLILQKQSLVDRITTETTQIAELLKELPLLKKNVTALIQQEKKHHKELETAEQHKNKYLEQEKQHELLQQQLADNLKTLQGLHNKKTTIEKEIAPIAQAITTTYNPQKLSQEITKHKDTIAKHQEKLNKRLELKEEYLKLQEATSELHTQINNSNTNILQQYEIDHKLITEQLQNTTKQESDFQTELKELTTSLKQTSHKLTQHETQLVTTKKELLHLDQTKKSFHINNNVYQKLIEKGSLIKQTIIDLESKEEIAAHNDQPCCPLCEQNLSASRKTFLHNKLQQQKLELNNNINNIKQEAQGLKKTLQEQHAAIQHEEKLNHDLATITGAIESIKQNQNNTNKQQEKINHKLTEIKQKIIELQKQKTAIEKQKKQILSEQKSSTLHTKYETNLKKIDALKQTAKKLAYNKEEHDNDLKQLSKLELDWKNHQNQQNNITVHEQLSKNLKVIINEEQQQQTTCKKIEAKIQQLKFDKQAVVTINQTIQNIKHNIASANETKAKLLQQQGALDSKATKEKELKKELSDLDTSLQTLQKEAQDYHDIIKTLGKDGIQALLIEEAIPEIEDEANILLGQLTNNQTHILIESLRDLKKGGSKETLDIKISDTAGIRPYEMFSGGEAFRIDFALRVAISKLLARRSGTTLQTLIIDEGFGSQDEESLQMIMDCIHKIQNNFAKIIVVSHLPSLKEQFPVHFHIQKKATGSTVTITEQG